MVRQISRILASLPPGRVPHVRGLSRTWVEYDLFPMLSPPGSTATYRKKKGGASPISFNPCTRKSANMGHPSRGKGLVGSRADGVYSTNVVLYRLRLAC